ncbi:MAG: putative cell division protein FtsQ [Actinomycetota bacterium]
MADKDNTPIGEPEELSVTEVSKEVLDELSILFGDAPPAVTNEPQKDPTAAHHDASATTNVVPLTSREETVVEADPTPDNVVVIASEFDDDVSDLTPAPPDPLIGLSRHGDDVVEISDDGSTVVIDADEMDRVVIIDNDTPDPTFEERRRRHQRRERLRRVKWFKLAGVVVAIIVFVAGVLASPLFAIRRVTFEGVVYTSPETVEKVTEAIKGASVFTVDTAKAREQLLEDPWVAEVRITTDFPGKALVEVAERKPVVWYVGDDEKARVVDDRGHVVAVLDGWPTKYLRVIGTGPSLDAGAIADDVYRAAAQLVLALPGEIRSKVKALELSGGGELAMILKTGTIVRFGPPTGLQDKLIAVVVLFRRQDPATLAVVDVSTGEPTVQLR